MRLLFFGDLAATGFGTVTSDLGRALIERGADVRFVSQNDFGQLPEMFASRTLDLTTFVMSNEGIEAVGDFIPSVLLGTRPDMLLADSTPWGEWKPDACFLLGDFYGMREMVTQPTVHAFKAVPSFHYVPIEGHDLPPNWNALWSVVSPIAMSRFGQEQIAKVTGQKPPLVYHGVDSEAFHPVSPTNPIVLNPEDEKRMVLTSKAACKYALLGDPSLTVALRVDRFMPRKGYDALIRAMVPVLRERPKMVLALHCRARDFGGYLPDTISKYPDVRDRILVPDFGAVPRPVLVAMYNAADIYVSTSAEGFGLTIAEALACGVPAVGLDYSAVPEVIGPAGTVVPVGKYVDNEYAHHWAFPDEEAFGRAAAYLVDHPHRRIETGRRGPDHVRAHFRWDVAAERFMDIAHRRLNPQDVSARELVAA